VVKFVGMRFIISKGIYTEKWNFGNVASWQILIKVNGLDGVISTNQLLVLFQQNLSTYWRYKNVFIII
jgi:hypothetical protein